jgi:hypothetical protein
MMATTHALAGVVLAVVFAAFFPETAAGTAPIPVVAAALGGLFPDFDLYAGHRKTLHFPVYFSAVAVPAIAVAVLYPTTLTLSVALFFAAAALHSVMDAYGGGLELKPWLGTSERAVYNHYHGRWIAPKRWVRYDGAPEDLAVAGVFAVPTLYVFDGYVQTGALAALGISAAYVLLRKPMVTFAEYLVDALPAEVLSYVPNRFVDDFR